MSDNTSPKILRPAPASVAAPPKPEPAASWLENLRKLAVESGPNRNDQVIVVISACISDGINTQKGIFEVAARLGLNTRHVAKILNLDTGTDPDRHRWWRDDRGLYRLHA